MLKPYDKNAKKHDKKQIQQIAESIKAFGMNQPIVVDKDDNIIVGHGRYLALQLLGWEIKPEWIIKKENLTDEEVKAYRLADNKLNESEWDMGLAIGDLKELSGEMFDVTGFDRDMVEGIDNAQQINELAVEREIDLGQYQVLTVEAPEAPRLKARVSFYTRNVEEFEKIKRFFDCKSGVLDLDKLLSKLDG